MAGLSRFAGATLGPAAIGAIFVLAGCAQDPPPPVPQAAMPEPQPAVVVASEGTVVVPPPPAPPVREKQSIVFYDSDVFDLGFADALRHRADEVHVAFAGPTSLNSFPARMNVWLAEVKKSNGNVTVVDPNQTVATRGLFGVGIIFDLIDAINTMQERRALSNRLALVHPYDATIIYDAATGTAREVVFAKRPPPPPPAGLAPMTGPAPVTGPVPTTSGT